jgi:hypothetical protein
MKKGHGATPLYFSLDKTLKQQFRIGKVAIKII